MARTPLTPERVGVRVLERRYETDPEFRKDCDEGAAEILRLLDEELGLVDPPNIIRGQD
jgi:hypothetical protein